MAPMNRRLLCFLVVAVAAAASPAWLMAEDLPGRERQQRAALLDGAENGPRQNIDDLVVSKVRIGRHADKTRVVLDLDGEADFSHHIDETGRMVVLDLWRVEWMARQFSKSKVGLVDGYVFTKGNDGASHLGIAAAVPVRIKAAFRLPPDVGKGHRIVLDLAPLDPMVGQELMNQELVSPDKAALLMGKKDIPETIDFGGLSLTEQEKAVESRFAPAGKMPFFTNASPVRVVMTAPPPFMALPGQPKVKCKDFPQIAWWRNNTHQETINYVNLRHKGDWDDYIHKWQRHLDKIANAFVAGKKALIKAANVVLSNEGYIDYIGKIEERISVIQCLAREKFLAPR